MWFAVVILYWRVSRVAVGQAGIRMMDEVQIASQDRGDTHRESSEHIEAPAPWLLSGTLFTNY